MKNTLCVNVKFCTLHPNTSKQVSTERQIKAECVGKDSKILTDLMQITSSQKPNKV